VFGVCWNVGKVSLGDIGIGRFGGLCCICLMWCLWREHNGQSFENCESNIVELKLLFFRTLFNWVSVRGFVSCDSLHHFLDSYTGISLFNKVFLFL
jgi:hypothetical protein